MTVRELRDALAAWCDASGDGDQELYVRLNGDVHEVELSYTVEAIGLRVGRLVPGAH